MVSDQEQGKVSSTGQGIDQDIGKLRPWQSWPVLCVSCLDPESKNGWDNSQRTYALLGGIKCASTEAELKAQTMISLIFIFRGIWNNIASEFISKVELELNRVSCLSLSFFVLGLLAEGGKLGCFLSPMTQETVFVPSPPPAFNKATW